MIALADGNCFFVSCERVFNPLLEKKAVIVLSNNDGCAIARSPEAKALGVKMGEPAFKLKHLIDSGELIALSSNYVLYGDMSNRMMSTFAELVPEIEVYSIDEAFLYLDGINNIKELSTKVVNVTQRNIGIPVCVGVSYTKTLAKLANHFAKKYPKYNKVCIIDTEEKRIKALKIISVGDIWGIGRQWAKKLENFGIKKAYDFTLKSRSWVRKYFTVTGERIWLELQGIRAIDKEIESAKKQICTSRSFSDPVTELKDLHEAVANYTASCALKLRKQHSAATTIIVFAYTNRFQNNQPQYFPSYTQLLSVATNNTSELISYAKSAINKIYKKGYKYKKAGVIVSDIIPENQVQGNLFDNVDRDKQKKIDEIFDSINKRIGAGSIKTAAQSYKKNKLNLKREYLSKRFTTNLNELIKIKV